MGTANPSTGLILGTFFLGLLTSVFWPLTQYLITMAHEGSHAIFGSMTGSTVARVKLAPDGSGHTALLGRNFFLAVLMGYAGPSLFGIVGATMLANHLDPDVVLWVTLALFVAILLRIHIKDVFGWLAVIVAGFFFFMVVHFGSAGGRTVLAYTWIWFLLFGGFIQNVRHNVRTTSQNWSVDAKILRDMVKLPRGFWGLLWWLTTLAALVYGGGILFGAIDPPLGNG